MNSALQRARQSLADRLEPISQQAARRALGAEREAALVEAFVAAWEAADVDRLVSLLADDVRFAMPPMPAWFDGVGAVRAFFAERVFETPWRLVPMTANGQLAFACYRSVDGGETFALGAINVLTLRGDRIVDITGFLDPSMQGPFAVTDEFASDLVSYREALSRRVPSMEETNDDQPHRRHP